MKSFVVFLVLSAATACAQSNASDAALEGYVRDPSGAVVAAAKVSVRNVETNILHETVTGEDGYYRFPLLRLGNYQVTAGHDEAVTLGGPIRKDKIFFFGQFENNPYTLPNPITITPANAAALKLPAHDIGSAPFGETYRTDVLKTDYKINDRNTGYLRYDHFTNHQPGNASGLTITDRGNNFDDHMNGGGAQLATVLRPNLLNELRGGESRAPSRTSRSARPIQMAPTSTAPAWPTSDMIRWPRPIAPRPASRWSTTSPGSTGAARGRRAWIISTPNSRF